jgi:hypothetical protein
VREQATLPRILQLEGSNLGPETCLFSLKFIVVFPIQMNSGIVGLPSQATTDIHFTIHYSQIILPFDVMCELLMSSLNKLVFHITLINQGYIFKEYCALLSSFVFFFLNSCRANVNTTILKHGCKYTMTIAVVIIQSLYTPRGITLMLVRKKLNMGTWLD